MHPITTRVWHNAGFYSYAMNWDAEQNVFWLDLAEDGQVRITTLEDLANIIYSTLGDVGIYAYRDDENSYAIFHHGPMGGAESMNSGENNQWSVVLAQLLTSFTAGYYGTTGQPVNPAIAEGIDLNHNWNPCYAFGRNLQGDALVSHDPYLELLFFNSNSYGSGYSDNLMKHYQDGASLLSVSDPMAGRNIDSIALTLFDDGEPSTGYQPPVINNYIDPGGNPLWQTVSFDPPQGESLWQVWQLSQDNGVYSVSLVANTRQGIGQMLSTNFSALGSGGDT